MVIYIYCVYWLVVSTPLENMKVSWDYFPNIWKNEIHVPNHHFITLYSARNVGNERCPSCGEHLSSGNENLWKQDVEIAVGQRIDEFGLPSKRCATTVKHP